MLSDLDEILGQDGGATFVTADLHVHSYGTSHDVTDKTMSVQALVESAVARNIGILSITDHNNDAQVLPSLECAAKYSDRLLVIPGVEISTAHGHLLVYCDPSSPEIITTLLARIELKGPKGSRDSRTPWSMSTVIEEAARLGAISIPAHIDREKSGFETLAGGHPHWKRDIILADGLYGLEFDDPAKLTWYSPEDAGSNEAGTRRAFLAERADVPGLTPKHLAAVQNSDAHTLAAFKADRPLTRYKMTERTFEGFRTALIDAEARVRAVATVPPSIPKIIGMKMIGGFVDGGLYRLSPNLNCFIGGRGTGKSTAVQALAFALGANEKFHKCENCPTTTIVICEDANGIRYRYERERGGTWEVQAEDAQGNAVEAPDEGFRVEFYKQGHLAEVSKNPLKNPELLQEFLDQHLILGDAIADEKSLVEELEHNSAELRPLEAGAQQRLAKRQQLKEISAKLKIAEEGKLQDVAAAQTQLASEKAFVTTLEGVAKFYEGGVSLSVLKKSFTALREPAGDFTSDTTTVAAFEETEKIIARVNALLKAEESKINDALKQYAKDIRAALKPVPDRHAKWEQRMSAKIAELRRQGLSGNVSQLNQLIAQRSQLTTALIKLDAQRERLAETQTRRAELLRKLTEARTTLSSRRRAHVSAINETFKRTIHDYSVYLRYDKAGICEDFVALMGELMNGSFMQDKDIERMCRAVDPLRLAELVREEDESGLASIDGVGDKWTPELRRRLAPLEHLHRLQVVAKPPAPVIKVLTKTVPQTEIPITQLSDGQKHTVLLTIALLAESNDPLIIDQPEDDLDNAFIFASVVSTLRYIKERRQVVIVTHNANIAVLGDSELLCPMKRSGNAGVTFERGSIDRRQTKTAAQDVLEGGERAFLKRQALYGLS
jgi:AAA domain, putative AbiEii toxin, Type IV TA system